MKLKSDNLCCLCGHLFYCQCGGAVTRPAHMWRTERHMPSTHVEDRAHVHESVSSSPMWTPGVAQSPALSAAVLSADPLTGHVGTF